MQRPGYVCFMWQLSITASLASTGSCRFWMHVFFRDRDWEIPEPTPGIWWLGRRHRASVFLRQKSCMESRHCPLSSCRLRLSSVYSRVWELIGRETLRMLVFTSESGIHKLVNLFASCQRPRWMELTSHQHWFNILLVSDSSLFGQQTKMQYVYTGRLYAQILGRTCTHMVFIRGGSKLVCYMSLYSKACEMDGWWVEPLFWDSVEQRQSVRALKLKQG